MYERQDVTHCNHVNREPQFANFTFLSILLHRHRFHSLFMSFLQFMCVCSMLLAVSSFAIVCFWSLMPFHHLTWYESRFYILTPSRSNECLFPLFVFDWHKSYLSTFFDTNETKRPSIISRITLKKNNNNNKIKIYVSPKTVSNSMRIDSCKIYSQWIELYIDLYVLWM